MLGHRCCAWAFSSCGKWGLLSSCFVRPSHYGGFARGAWVLGYLDFGGCGARAPLTHGMWDLPRPGIKLVSLAFQGVFLTIGPIGNPYLLFLNLRLMSLVSKPLLNHLPFLLAGMYSKKRDQSYNNGQN